MLQAVRRSKGWLLAAVLVTLATTLVAPPTSSAQPVPVPKCTDSYTLRYCVAYLANEEYSNDDGHKYEKPLGSNCNYFTAHVSAPGASDCGNGYRSEEWCMDFSKWVYRIEGAAVTNLNNLAFSAKNYPTYKTYASGRRPKLGDLAVWAHESHVGIVVSVSGSNATVVSGNSWNPARGDYTAIYKKSYPASTFQGFAGPKF
jgi:hypothetical protein